MASVAASNATYTPGPDNSPEWQERQREWLAKVRTGAVTLSEVPVQHRRDEVCIFASAQAIAHNGKPAMEVWAADVLPFIPADVLYYGYLNGNYGHLLKEEMAAATRKHESVRKRTYTT